MEIPESTIPPTTEARVQNKRRASPIQQRNVKQRHNLSINDVTMNNADVITNDPLPTTSTDQTAQGNSPINNTHFATFKNLRKMNFKVITAKVGSIKAYFRL